MKTMLPTMRYRLGLDLGAKSLGWAMIRLNANNEPVAIIKMGVRIFSDGRDPQDGSSLAVTRREARQARRRRDRFLRRKRSLTNALIELGFFPQDATARHALVTLDPYALRKKGLYEALTPPEFARALFHINQRRGFKSNRKTDKKDNDSSVLKSAIRRISEQLTTEGAQTVGEWLANRHAQRIGVRARLHGKGKDRAYDLYIDRSMIEAEFETLWAKQASFSPELFTASAHDRLKDILLFQRRLKPVVPGRCTLLSEEPRARLALPSVQQFRIYQELNNLKILDATLNDVSLTLEQRNTLALLLERRKDMTFTAACKHLGLPGTTRFNLQDEKRDRLKGNETSVRLSREDLFGDRWHSLSLAEQDAVALRLATEESVSTVVTWLQSDFGCDSEQACRIADVPLPEGYGSLSVLALEKILPALRGAVISYAQAVQLTGLGSHSARSLAEQTGEIMQTLPYYGEALQRHVGFGSGKETDSPEMRYGRIANPTVHIGLNEVRKVVNALIERYGHPSEVIIEVARTLKQGKALRDEIQKEQKQRQDENIQYRDLIRPLIGGHDPTRQDVQRFRLWVELNPHDVANRRCPYTGEPIGMSLLFSDAVEIEHILPFSQTLDDTLNNKVLSMRRANRDKGNRSPHDAFGHSPPGYHYDDILERAKLMPRAKQQRFAPDALAHWLRDDKDFLARALNDTAYLSKVAKEYLMLVCDKNQVRVIPGRLTALLRGKYGLNALLSGSQLKNRHDHRHHAIDAAVIGITDQPLLQRFANANQYAREKGLQKLVETMPLPWPRYIEHVASAVNHLVVSIKPDHGHQGALHDASAYGLRADGQVARREPLATFKSAKEVAATTFADPQFKEWLLQQVNGLEGKPFMERIEQLARENGAHRARLVTTLKVIPIVDGRSTVARHGTDAQGNPRAYKGYKGNSNFCMEIACDERGKWSSTVLSTYEANQLVRQYGLGKLRDPKLTQDGKPLVMRLMKGDYIRLDCDGRKKLMVIAVIGSSGQVFLAEHHESNVDARNRNKAEGFKYFSKSARSLQAANAEMVSVSPIGRIGHPTRRT